MGPCRPESRLQHSRPCISDCAPASPSLWVLSKRHSICKYPDTVLRTHCMSHQQRMATAASVGSVQSPSAPRPLQRWSQAMEGLSWGSRTRSHALQSGSAPLARPLGLLSRLYASVVRAAAAPEGVTSETFKESAGSGPRHLVVMANGLFGSACELSLITARSSSHMRATRHLRYAAD